MFSDYIILAFHNLKSRGIRSWLTMLGIFIGIAAVVSMISLGNGLQRALTAQFSSLSTDTLTLQNAGTGFGPPGSTVIKKLTDSDIKLVQSIPGVELVIGRIIRLAKVEYNGVIQFNYLVNLPEEKKSIDFIYKNLNVKVQSGRLLQAEDRGYILLGDAIANDNAFGKKIKVGDKISIQGREFKVIGILKKASSFQINLAIIMLDKDMREILNIPKEEFDLIVIKLNNKDIVQQTAKTIEEKIRKDRNQKPGEEDFTVQTPLQALSAVTTILNIINLVVFGIATISLLVGGIGIANNMFTSVIERTREIGIMKAIGAKNRDILFIFLIESGLLGLVGGIIGAILGFGLSFLVSFFVSQLLGEQIFNVIFSLPLFFGALVFSFLIGVFSGIIPALNASSLKPTEALRR